MTSYRKYPNKNVQHYPVVDYIQDQGLQMAQLSRDCGIDSTTFWRIVHNKRVPQVSTFKRIADVLGLTLDEYWTLSYGTKGPGKAKGRKPMKRPRKLAKRS